MCSAPQLAVELFGGLMRKPGVHRLLPDTAGMVWHVWIGDNLEFLAMGLVDSRTLSPQRDVEFLAYREVCMARLRAAVPTVIPLFGLRPKRRRPMRNAI
jgi:hypothetical protein